MKTNLTMFLACGLTACLNACGSGERSVEGVNPTHGVLTEVKPAGAYKKSRSHAGVSERSSAASRPAVARAAIAHSASNVGDANQDAPLPDASRPALQVDCNPLPLGPVVYTMGSPAAHPVEIGGVPAPGRYVLTDETLYSTGVGGREATGDTTESMLEISSKADGSFSVEEHTRMRTQVFANQPPMIDDFTFTWTVSPNGTTWSESYSCPPPADRWDKTFSVITSDTGKPQLLVFEEITIPGPYGFTDWMVDTYTAL